MIQIAPSILNADFLQLGNVIEMLNSSEADMIHLDIMDGNFVPNLSFGLPVIQQIKSVAKKDLDVHLMISNPDLYIEEYYKAGANSLTVHYETCPHLHRTIQRIKALGMKAAVCLNPHSPVNLLHEIIGDLDMVLIMTVNPGFGGQKFIEQSYEKIGKLKKMISDRALKTKIQIDGGVNLQNIRPLADAGVDVFVVGSTIFAAENPKEMISKLKNT
ncbi:MAG: ribulose-phosphate 3-epimerase [Bacteroidales bacterium]|nr:ribulose-phosphate 3-epimerase [Bacteroidales bacterium]MCF8391637.1 ribulose-phosphate 3-epimerase [Bacteroidales bacterium]